MRFSSVVDYKGQPHFVCKTGRKNIRILKPGDPYEKSFKVPLSKVSNKRPAEYEPEDDENDDVDLEDVTELLDDENVSVGDLQLPERVFTPQ